MPPVALTDDEWDVINKELPDVRPVADRLLKWPYTEWIDLFDFDLVKRLRLSSVRFRDAVESSRRARYALGQAVGARKYYMDRRLIERDQNHADADFHSLFYADYIPHLLYTACELACKGLMDLFDPKSKANYQGKYTLKKTLTLFTKEFPADQITRALENFDRSQAREVVWLYRDKWVHDKAPRIETIFYNPPYEHFTGKLGQMPMSLLGAKRNPDYDYTWEDFLDKLKLSLADTLVFLEACLDEWEHVYASGNDGYIFPNHPR